MKAKKVLAAVLAMLMLFTMLPLTASAETDPAATPITTQQELAAMNPAGNYYLANDIVLTGSWTPIGYTGSGKPTSFSGTFDGNGHKITGLNINLSSASGYAGQYIGLFAANSGTIKNLTVENGAVKGYKGVGTIVGVNSGRVENCTVTGGDVIGAQVTSSVNALYASANYIGGITGQNTSNGVITGCSASAYVEGIRWIGGIAGANFGQIEKSSVSGTGVNNKLKEPAWGNNAAIVMINASKFVYANVGGLAGENQGAISNCYVTKTTVQGWDYVGGLVGEMEQTSGTITNSYGAENIIGGYPDGYSYSGYTMYPEFLDFTVGCYSAESQLSGVYCAADSTKIPTSGTRYTIVSGILKQQSTFAGYDFDTVWTMEGSEANSGYPVFKPAEEPQPTDPILSVTVLDLNEDTEISSIYQRAKFRVRVVADDSVEGLRQQNEYGLTLLMKDLTCTDNGDGTLTYEYITAIYTVADQRTILVIPTVNDADAESDGSYTLDVLANAAAVNSAYFTDAQTEVNTPVVLTVETNIDTVKLRIYNEYGTKMGGVTYSYVDEGDTRVWTCTMTIGSVGNNRTFYVEGKNIEGTACEKTATNAINVIKPPAGNPVVSRAYFAETQAVANAPIVLTVETNTDTAQLSIYNEYGMKMGGIGCSYADEGDTRTWTCTMKIGTAGTGRMFSVEGRNADGVTSEKVSTNTIDIVRAAV